MSPAPAVLAGVAPPPGGRRERAARAAPPAVGCCLAAGAVYVGLFDPSDGGGLTVCPVRATTGMWCPGCGLTRATHHLLRGDVVPALSDNLLVPAILVGLVAAWATWWSVTVGRGVPRLVAMIPVRAYVLAGVVLAAFTAVRNVPAASALRGTL